MKHVNDEAVSCIGDKLTFENFLSSTPYYCNNSQLKNHLSRKIEKLIGDEKNMIVELEGTKVRWIVKKMSQITAQKYGGAQYKVLML